MLGCCRNPCSPEGIVVPCLMVVCRNALHFKHCGVIYRFEQMSKYRHTISIVVNVVFTPNRL